VKKLAPCLAPFALAGCGGPQSMLGAAGRDGAQFAGLWQLFLIVTVVFYLIVLAGLTWAVLRRREGGEAVITTGLYVWVGVISVTLVGLTIASWLADRHMNRSPYAGLTVEITAHQWWWDMRYSTADASQTLRTSNELHLPAGVPVRVILKSADVIHSFWIPTLSGKQDLIPGRINDMDIKAEKVGLYRSQCAEYCGAQHAHMAFDVTVEPLASFEKWWGEGLLPARAPVTPLEKAGYAYVTTRECSTCHNITDTPATGQVAPDLTHFASRLTIGAGTLPMTRGYLHAWLADPQGAKPGNKMPVVGLEPDQLNAIAAYLESLK
jgi:cytochrome c oxidase subunit 2